ncbi:MAG: preprotein translocase subunit SecE [Chloroflexota bacterium]
MTTEKANKVEKPAKKAGGLRKALTAARSEEGQPNVLVRYFRETRGELRKVTWPTRAESQRLTVIVLGVSAVMALFLGLLDFGFSRLLQLLVNLVAL